MRRYLEVTPEHITVDLCDLRLARKRPCRQTSLLKHCVCSLLVALLGNPVLFRVILPLLVHFESLLAARTQLFGPLVVDLILQRYRVASERREGGRVVVQVILEITLILSFPLKLLLIKQVGISSLCVVLNHKSSSICVILLSIDSWRRHMSFEVASSHDNSYLAGVLGRRSC